jgi:hypothetical protein
VAPKQVLKYRFFLRNLRHSNYPGLCSPAKNHIIVSSHGDWFSKSQLARSSWIIGNCGRMVADQEYPPHANRRSNDLQKL